MARVPEELLKFRNWVAYEKRMSPDNEDESRLVLMNSSTGLEAKSNDSSTWSDYESAEAKAKTLENGGVLFMFGEHGKPCGIAAINLRNCYEDSLADNFDWGIGEPKLKPYAQEIVSLMDSYTEHLQTGGVRIFFRTTKSLHELDASIDYFKRNSALGIEICDSVYYCEVTGNGYSYNNNGDVKPVNERTEQARQVITKYFTKQELQTQERTQAESSESHNVSEPDLGISNAEYLASLFGADMKNYQKYGERKTGFSNLDGEDNKYQFIKLYPGLYVIGAVSSGGKTTFYLQLADNLAAMGEHVLFFAFEQTRFELVSKSLARLSQPEGAFYESNPTAIEIRNGQITSEVREAMQKFEAISQNSRIIECDFKTDISKIENTVEAYIKKYGVKPVVFVDYLQLITSDNRSDKPRLTSTKDIVDSNVRALKLLQMRHELLIFVVSSINRENYATSIDFQSFKETGGIEFTADVVMGLQSYIIHDKLFDGGATTNINKRRKALGKAKRATPRAIELRVLKNRYGLTNMSFYFQYYPQYELFIPATLRDMKDANQRLIDSLDDDEDDYEE